MKLVSLCSNVILTKEDYEEIEETKKQLRKIKMPKECYFEGFKEVKMKKIHKKKPLPLKGFIQSGILFIGDPVYMSGDLSQSGSELLESHENPFLNWGKFTDGLADKDQSLPFPGAIEDNSSGRGIVVQTGRLSGRYEVEKKFDESGRLAQLIVKFYE